jgi:drug/metabolite transporter (DMT)-like permease
MSKGIQYMLIATMGFALIVISVKFIPNIPAHEIVLARSIISLLISVVMLRHRKIPLLGNRRGILLLRGVFGVTALTLFFITIQNIQLASAITVQYTSPIFTIVFAIFILKEKVSPATWFFFALAFAGVLVVKGFDDTLPWFYVMLGLISAVFSGLAYNCIRLVKDTDHPLVVVLYFPLIALPVMAILTCFNFVMPVGWDWLYLVAIGILTQIAQLYMTKAYHAEDMAYVSIVRYLGIGYALFFGYIFFDETYSMLSLFGMGLVLLGIIGNLIYRSRIAKTPSK